MLSPLRSLPWVRETEHQMDLSLRPYFAPYFLEDFRLSLFIYDVGNTHLVALHGTHGLAPSI